jgi:hypothetical protein
MYRFCVQFITKLWILELFFIYLKQVLLVTFVSNTSRICTFVKLCTIISSSTENMDIGRMVVFPLASYHRDRIKMTFRTPYTELNSPVHIYIVPPGVLPDTKLRALSCT